MKGLSTLKPRIQSLQAKGPAKLLENHGKGRGGRPWRRKRDAILERDHHQCQPCKRNGFITLADEVDHIIPLSQGGTDDDVNLEAICKPCHDTKSQRESKGG